MNTTILMEQIHGNNVSRVGKREYGKTIDKCDGLITNDPKVVLGVRVADCLPVFIKDLENGSIGLVHAGWRGLDKGIIKKTILLMRKEFKSNPKDLKVLIGPHICANHYEIKADVSGKFLKYKNCILKNGPKKYLDLASIAKIQLVSLYVKPENIKIDESCTYEEENLFSFRKNGTKNRNVYFFSMSS